MSYSQQTNVVRLRPGIIITLIVIVGSIVALIMFNLFSTIHTMHTHPGKQDEQEVHAMASNADTSWYQHETINKIKKVEKNNTQNGAKNNNTTKTINTDQISYTPPVQLMTQNEKDVLEAMKAPITSNQLTDQQAGFEKNQINNQINESQAHASLGERDSNRQDEKLSFLSQNHQAEDEYLHSMLKSPISRYELQAGTIIPGILISGINSDLPGQIIGQVQSNVYDSISGQYLLIPQGAKIQGIYDARVAYGQERVLVVWKRIIYPNGQSLNLEGMPGIDMSGYAGFQDQVNNHYGKLFGSVLLMSVLASGAQLSQPQQSNNPFAGPTVGQTLAQSLGTNIANVGTAVVSKNLNIQPTLEIRQGYQFNISVTKDIVFIKPYEA